MTTKPKPATPDDQQAEPAIPICGLVMPISAMPPLYDAQHWIEVREAFEEAIRDAGMRPQMVSDSFESDVIQQRIISNIFNNPVVLVDVSGLNPNVMFELGLRLASKKATIIVTDDVANLPFDTRIIEHYPYPKSLRLRDARKFISDLTAALKRALDQVSGDTYNPFLNNFTGVDTTEPNLPPISDASAIRDRLDDIYSELRQLQGKTLGYASGLGVPLPWDNATPFRIPTLGEPISYKVQARGSNVKAIDKTLSAIRNVRHVGHQILGDDLVIDVWINGRITDELSKQIDDVIIRFTEPWSK